MFKVHSMTINALHEIDGGECESMGKQCIRKFQAAEASYILRYNVVQGT